MLKVRQKSTTDEESSLLKRYGLEGWPNAKAKLEDYIKPCWHCRGEINIIPDLFHENHSSIIPANFRNLMLPTVHSSHMRDYKKNRI